MTEFKYPSDQQWRVNTYRLLANLLAKPPSKRLLLQLCGLKPDQSDVVTNELPAVWVALSDSARQSSVETVRNEYNLLFVGMTRGEVLPYASWYLTGFLMEKPLAALREDLRRLGMERQPGTCEPEDHAAALLEVMSILIETGSDNQRTFFELHINPWMKDFFADLDNAESAGFYRSVAQLGCEFLSREQTSLFDLVQ